MPGLAVMNAVQFQKEFVKPQVTQICACLFSDVNKCRHVPLAMSNWYFSSVTQSIWISKTVMKKQGITSELNMGTDFNLKKAETGEKRLLL